MIFELIMVLIYCIFVSILLYKIKISVELTKTNNKKIKEYDEMNNHIDTYNKTIIKKLLDSGIIVDNLNELIDKLIELTNNHIITWSGNDESYYSMYKSTFLSINKYDNILYIDNYLKFADINLLIIAIKKIEEINTNIINK